MIYSVCLTKEDMMRSEPLRVVGCNSTYTAGSSEKYKTSLPVCPETAAPARLSTISLCMTRLSLFTCKLENKISYVNGKPLIQSTTYAFEGAIAACASHEFVLAET